jgi:hypothetical protein
MCLLTSGKSKLFHRLAGRTLPFSVEATSSINTTMESAIERVSVFQFICVVAQTGDHHAPLLVGEARGCRRGAESLSPEGRDVRSDDPVLLLEL